MQHFIAESYKVLRSVRLRLKREDYKHSETASIPDIRRSKPYWVGVLLAQARQTLLFVLRGTRLNEVRAYHINCPT